MDGKAPIRYEVDSWSSKNSRALGAVIASACPTQRTGAAFLLDYLAVIGGATDAVVAGGIKAQGAATALLDRAAGVAAA